MAAKGKNASGKVFIGISSWTEPTLIKEGNFYPKGASSAEDRLKFYASAEAFLAKHLGGGRVEPAPDKARP